MNFLPCLINQCELSQGLIPCQYNNTIYHLRCTSDPTWGVPPTNHLIENVEYLCIQNADDAIIQLKKRTLQGNDDNV
jgi:hypothetical protein